MDFADDIFHQLFCGDVENTFYLIKIIKFSIQRPEARRKMISLLKRKGVGVQTTETNSSTVIEIDAYFYSFADFEVVKRTYEQEHRVNLCTQHSTQLKGDDFNIFRYKYARYSCNRGGRTYNTDRERKRKTSSILVGCPMFFKLGFQKRRRRLAIISMIAEHSSECAALRSREEFAMTTPQRRISGALREEVKRMMAVGADKRAILAHLTQERHKMVTMKDLFNIAYDAKRLNREKIARQTLINQQTLETQVPDSVTMDRILNNPETAACASAPVGARMHPRMAPTPCDSHKVSTPSSADLGGDDSGDLCVSHTKDPFSAFGEYVAEELRTVTDSFSLQVAKHRINEVLFEATTGQYGVDRVVTQVVEDNSPMVVVKDTPAEVVVEIV